MLPNRPIILLLCAACVAFASSSSAHRQDSPKNSLEHHHRSAATLASTFAVSVRDGVNLTLDVKNNTNKMVELRFPNGKTHDFFVLDDSGREVWRWSSGRMFTQAMQAKLVKSKDNAVFSDTWRASNAHGKFTAVAVLASENHPVEERVEFALR
jgi:Intracellular proteinase inhibitor